MSLNINTRSVSNPVPPTSHHDASLPRSIPNPHGNENRRSTSPSPSASPTPALLACPPLDRCFSTNSTCSDISQSTMSRSSMGSNATGGTSASRRRGYVRPQGASFAQSAKNRDSVMSLGSIAHLQYYFARTGILDGKGAQMARGRLNKKTSSAQISVADSNASSSGNPPESPFPGSNFGGDIMASPTEEGMVEDGFASFFEGSSSGIELEDLPEGEDPFTVMLPPTVSTYNHRNAYVPPPPDVATLRRELRESMECARKALQDTQRQQDEREREGLSLGSPATTIMPSPNEARSPPDDGSYDGYAGGSPVAARSPQRGWHEIQGVHILDVVTLAIRAAKEYYSMHESPQRLFKVKPEKLIREELLQVMDVLKKMATRNFAGGVRPDEMSVMMGWIDGVEEFLVAEKAVEEQEAKEQESWRWLDDAAWDGQPDRARELDFIRSFLEDDEGERLPRQWTDPKVVAADGLPTELLRALASGVVLVQVHNRILKKSRRQFGEIKTFHRDTAVPYRAADNLRYWLKAAEIRWEMKSSVAPAPAAAPPAPATTAAAAANSSSGSGASTPRDELPPPPPPKNKRLTDPMQQLLMTDADVMAIAFDKKGEEGERAWRRFDESLLRWCREVRRQIVLEWRTGKIRLEAVPVVIN